jgi:Papain fold toxin 1, glutamine deamidase
MRRVLEALVVALMTALGVATAPTTFASAAACSYDAASATRTCVHRVEGGDAGAIPLRDIRRQSASPAASVRGPSLTPVVASNATEAGSVRTVNPLGGTNNCVNCAIATDATLKGSPASALNVPPGVRGQPISVLEDMFGGAFKPVSGQAQIESMLVDSGSGSTGIVFGARGNDVGHVFNAVNQGGTIRFLDGQTGGVASFDGFTDFYFLGT